MDMYNMGQQYVANGGLAKQPVVTMSSTYPQGQQQQQQQHITRQQQMLKQQQQQEQGIGSMLRHYGSELEEGLRGEAGSGVDGKEGAVPWSGRMRV
jgi:hypothetical protein